MSTNNYLFTHTSKQSFKTECFQARGKRHKSADLTLTRILIQSCVHKRHMAIIQSMENEKKRRRTEKKSMECGVDSFFHLTQPWSPHTPFPHLTQRGCAGANIIVRKGKMSGGVVMWCNHSTGMHNQVNEASRPSRKSSPAASSAK